MASLIWGSIGLGFFIYGKKQRSGVPMAGGVLLMLTSYFAGSAMTMSLISIAVIAGIWALSKQGI